MVRYIKFLIFFFLVLAIGAGSLAFLFDPNIHKGEIARFVEERTGRPLTIREDVSLSLFPWVGLRLGAMELGNAPGFGPEPLARIASAHIQVKWWPLWQRRVEVDSVTLHGLQINLEKNGAGINNWAGLGRSSGQPPAQGPTTAPDPTSHAPADQTPSPEPRLLAAMIVEGIQVLDTLISWRDATKNGTTIVTIPKLTTGAVRENAPVPVTLQLHMTEEGDTPLTVDLEMKGALLVQLAEKMVRMKPLQIALTAQGKGLPSGKERLDSTLNLEVDWPNERVRLEEWQISTSSIGQPPASGAEWTMNGHMEGQHLLSAPQITGTWTVPPFPLREVLQRGGLSLPKTQDPKALGEADGVISLVADSEGLTLTNGQGHLDGSQWQGQLAVQDFSHPAIHWDLTLDRLDIDRYRPPTVGTRTAEGVEVVEHPAEKINPSIEPSPASTGRPLMAPLHSLEMKGRLRVDQLKVANLTLQGVDMPVQGKQGMIQLAPVQAHLYQGALAMDLLLDTTGTTPSLTVDGHLEGVQAGPLWQDLKGHAPVTGVATVHTHLTTTGETEEGIKKNLRGTGRFALKEGVIQGVDLQKLLNDASLLLKGQPAPASEGREETPFSSLDGSVTITNGVVDNRDLNLLSSLWRVRGAGTVNLPTEQVDYLLKASVVEPPPEQGGRTLTELAGVTVPVRVTGHMAHPAWKLEVKTLLEQGVTAKAKEKLSNKIQDKATEFLKKQGLNTVLPPDVGKRLLDALPFR